MVLLTMLMIIVMLIIILLTMLMMSTSQAIYDYHTGECMATMAGHSELVTGLAFSNDCRHLISVSGDSCIFVWRLPGEMVSTMQARLAASPNKNASRTYITSPVGMETEDFGTPPPEFLDPNANPVANDNDAYR